jgi:hypothetical protein
MLKRIYRASLAVLLGGLMALQLPGEVAAHVDTCTVTVAPAIMSPGSLTTLDFTIHNDSGPAIVWIQALRPNQDYRVRTVAAPGWTDDTNFGGTTLTGGSVGTGGDVTFQMTVRATILPGDPGNWYVQASDDGGGASPTVCGGSNTTQVQGALPNGSNQGVSGVMVSSVTESSAVVSWTSDAPTGSIVFYGTSSGYGSATDYDNSAPDTSHSVSLSGLSAGTGYHFQVAGMDANGDPYYSGDSTFLTLASGSGGGGSTGGGGGNGGTGAGGAGAGKVQVGGGTVTTPGGQPTETVPPQIALTSSVSGSYKSPPSFTGTASDNDAVAKVEYSIDGGKNWSGANTVTPKLVTTVKGKQKTTVADAHNVTFSFVPVINEDGNYAVVARATDPSGNQATTSAVTLVIDRLPPRFGGEMVAFGAQAARPDASGRWQATVGLDQTITLNAVGGPTAVTIAATKEGAGHTSQNFALRQDEGSGLWRGVLSFQAVGVYTLEALAVDGAGNRAKQALAGVAVSAPARLMGKARGGQDQPVSGAKVTLYYRQPGSGQWVVWDGAGFGQRNPQVSKANGAFEMLVPAGTYYLKVEARDYQTLVSRQFVLDQPTPLVPTVRLTARPRLGWGKFSVALPWVSVRREQIQPAGAAAAGGGVLVGHSFPAFDLPNTAGGTTGTVGLLGKPTLVTVMSTWAPSTSEQMPALARLQANHDLNVVPLMLGERPARVQAFLGRSGYDVDVTIDGDAVLGQALGTPSLPTHYVVDRKGVVRAVVTGVVPAQKLLDLLGS